MNKIKLLIGKIKSDAENWGELGGITLLVTQFNDDEWLMVLRPIYLDEMEKFYKVNFEKSLKDFISDDYDYCIWYLLNEDCEFTCHIQISDLEDIREVAEEDIKVHEESLEEFKKIHKVSEYQRKFEEEEKQEAAALKEFEEAEKSKIQLSTKDGIQEVDGIIYKGFGVHNLFGYDEKIIKSITILDGECKGWQLAKCSVAKYKQFINEVRQAIGDRSLSIHDTEIIKQIAIKY